MFFAIIDKNAGFLHWIGQGACKQQAKERFCQDVGDVNYDEMEVREISQNVFEWAEARLDECGDPADRRLHAILES
jgi:hypothetical protein